MNPTCYPSLQMMDSWTYQPDSQTGGTCSITPGTDTHPMEVMFAPKAGNPWSNAYILHRNGVSAATAWCYVTSVTFPTQQDITNLNAYEQDWQKNDGHTIFNLGWQWLQGTGLRLWNRSTKSWQPPVLGPSCALFQPGVPKRIALLFAHDATTVTYLGVGLDDVWTPLHVTFPAIHQAQNPYVNNAIQLDSKGHGAPINAALNECTLSGF